MTDRVVAAIVVALGGAALAGSLGLGVGSPAAPGPGTWPFLISVALIVLGLVLAFRRSDDRFTRPGLAVVTAVAGMAVFVAVVGVIGFEIPTALLAFGWLRFIGRESWRTSAVVSLAVTVAFYLIFVGALSVSIPHLF
ncbi:tripartite tricarboxylate transporter TctB family protein [Actinoplanes sp. CA-131856]